jgi:hypothetical protein
MTLRDFVISYTLNTGTMSEDQWQAEFKLFCKAIAEFKRNAQ